MLLGGGYAAWAAQPATQAVVVPVDGIAAEIILRVDENAPKVLRVVNKAGTPFALDTDSDGKHFAIAGAVTRIEHKGKPALALKLRIAEDGKQVAEPKLIVLNGKPASIQIGDEVVAQDGSKIFKGLRLDVTLHDAAAKASQAAQVDASSRKANPPSYPKEAQQQSIGGMTVLTVDVAANGSVIAAKVKRTSGNAQLDAAALEAVQRWLFKPAMKSGKATASQVTVPIEFDPGLKPEKRVAAVRAALARQAEAARPAAVAAMSSTNTNWGGYDAMMHSLRGNWITGQQPSTEGC
jgi:TonB family protein